MKVLLIKSVKNEENLRRQDYLIFFARKS